MKTAFAHNGDHAVAGDEKLSHGDIRQRSSAHHVRARTLETVLILAIAALVVAYIGLTIADTRGHQMFGPLPAAAGVSGEAPVLVKPAPVTGGRTVPAWHSAAPETRLQSGPDEISPEARSLG